MAELALAIARGEGKLRLCGALGAALMLGACGVVSEREDRPTARDVDVDRIEDAVPRVEALSRYGNPPSYVVGGRRYRVMASSRGYSERGIASWYGTEFHGRRTSSGEVYDMYAMTAAHKSLPLPSYVAVRNLENGRRVVLRVNDRGPFHDNRLIDLSYVAARKLGIVQHGTGYVEVAALDPQAPETSRLAEGAGPMEQVRLYLQAGAFAVRSNAERLRERLASVAGGAAQIIAAEHRGQPIWRVRLGPLADVGDADRLVQTLIAMGLETPSIVLE